LKSINSNLDRIADGIEKVVVSIPEIPKVETAEKESSKGKAKKDSE
jgi:hypothetical protein